MRLQWHYSSQPQTHDAMPFIQQIEDAGKELTEQLKSAWDSDELIFVALLNSTCPCFHCARVFLRRFDEVVAQRNLLAVSS